MRILAATDFSSRSHRALRRAGLLAQAHNVELALVHVVDDDQPQGLVEMESREAERMLAEQIEAMPELREVQSHPMVVTGDPFDAILRTAAALSGSSGKLCGFGKACDPGLATRFVSPAPAPNKGMAMPVPVGCGLCHSLTHLLPTLKAAARKSQRAKDLPPRLDQVEVGGVFRLEHHLPTRVRQHEQEHIAPTMRVQIVHDRINPPGLGREPSLDLL